MASLTGQTIQSTYDALLKISGNDALTSSLQRITDGLGNFSPLYLSTTAVEISSGLNVVGSITGSNLSGTNTGDETNSTIKSKLGAATSSNDGYLTSTDWSTFNAKGNGTVTSVSGTGTVSGLTLTGTVTSSGSLTLGGSLTLTSTQITTGLGYTPVPNTRTLTINGTSYDLSADRSWTISTGLSGSGTTNYVPKFTGSTSLGNSLIFDNGTNVGIGTTSPSYPLQVNGLISSNRTSNTDGGLVIGTPANGNYIYGTDSGNYIATYTTNAERMRITSGGAVGIGTSSPARTLDINGSIAWGASAGQYMYAGGTSHLFAYSNSTLNVLYSGGTGGFGINNAADSSRLFQVTDAGNVGIGTTSPLARLNVQADNNDVNSGQLVISGATSDLKRMSIGYNTTGNYSFISTYTALSGYNNLSLQPLGGNVGIGTTSPGQLLSISSSTTNAARLRVTGTGTTAGNFRGYEFGSASGFRGGLLQDESTDLISIFTPIGGQSFNITSAGNVGIGTTSPNFTLGGRTVLDVNGGSQSLFCLSNAGTYSAYLWATASNVELSTNTQPLNFVTNGSERMRITSSGNVGIGTSSPTSIGGYIIQTINGPSGSFTEWQENGTNTFRVGSDVGLGGFIYTQAAFGIRFGTNGSERMRITSDGAIQMRNVFNRRTASYTLALGDAGKIVETNLSSANTVTVPFNTTADFPIGTEIMIMQYGSGQTTISPASGVSIRSKNNNTKIADQYTGATLVKVAQDEWYLVGNLTA